MRAHAVAIVIVFCIWTGNLPITDGLHVGQENNHKQSNVNSMEIDGGVSYNESCFFRQNHGQYPDNVIMYTDLPTYLTLFMKSEFIIVAKNNNYKNDIENNKIKSDILGMKSPRDNGSTASIGYLLLNASETKPIGTDLITPNANFFLGNNRTQWHENSFCFKSISYYDIYSGIDLIFNIADNNLKYEFIIYPNVNPDIIEISIEWGSISVITDREIVIENETLKIADTSLDVYQKDDAKTRINGKFVSKSDSSYGFDIGEYDIKEALIIDPVIFCGSIGGAKSDYGLAIGLDSNDNYLIVGKTSSLNYPISNNAMCRTYSGGFSDIILTRINANGECTYSSFIGGSRDDSANDIIIDGLGYIYLIGTTYSIDFPVTTQITKEKNSTDPDIFLMKLTPNADEIVYSICYGGSAPDRGLSLSFLTSGEIVLCGDTNSDDFPITENAQQKSLQGTTDGFISIINPMYNTFRYSTYLGGTGRDLSKKIVVDNGNDIIIAGETNSIDFFILNDSIQGQLKGSFDIFLLKINGTNLQICFSILLGGTAAEVVNSLAVDSKNRIFISGISTSNDFPITEDAIQKIKNRFEDGFLIQINSTGRELLYSTYIGGSEADACTAMMLDSNDTIILTGQTGSTDFPTTKNAIQKVHSSDLVDCFVLEINLELGITYSSFIGGSDTDIGYSLLRRNDTVVVVGITASLDFPSLNTTYNNSLGDDLDIFIVAFNITPQVLTIIADAGKDQEIPQYGFALFDGLNSTSDAEIIEWNWVFSYDGTIVSVSGNRVNFQYNVTGRYLINLTIKDTYGRRATDYLIVNVIDIIKPVADAGENQTIDQYTLLELNATRSYDNNGITDWQWIIDYPNERIIRYGQTIEFKFDIAGVVHVILRVYDYYKNWGEDAIFVNVTDTTPPYVDAGGNRTINQFEKLTLNSTGSHDNIGIKNITWSLYFENRTINYYKSEMEYVFNEAGVITVTLCLEDFNNNSATDKIFITVIDKQNPIAEAGPDIEVFKGATVVFNGTRSRDNTGIHEWKWVFQYGARNVVLNNSVEIFKFNNAGEFFITLIVIDSNGNEANDTLRVKVLDEKNKVNQSSFIFVLIIIVLIVSFIIGFYFKKKIIQ